MKIIKPKFWDKHYITFFSLLLWPLSFFYQIIFKLINGLDDCEDVQNVFYNFEFDEKSLQILEE